MIVVPSIDLESGRVVKRVRGVRGSGATDLGDPRAWADRWARAGCRALHVIDLDGAEGVARDQRAAVRAVIDRVRVPVAVGGGIRSTERIREWLDAGAERVLVATRFWGDVDWRTAVARAYPDRLTVCLDVADGRLRLDGWKSPGPPLDAAIEELRALAVASVLYTEIPSEGTGAGAPVNALRRLRARYSGEIRVAGGIGRRSDLARLAAAGADVAVVGHALIEGALPPSVVAEEFG